MSIIKGKILDDRYEIIREIGNGGSSKVYLVWDRHLERNWAVKEIRTASCCEGPDGPPRGPENEIRKWQQKLYAEADLLKQLNHPAIPMIADILKGTGEEEQNLYMVMEYITGLSLEEILESGRPLSPEEFFRTGIQICEVLEYLHSQDPPVIFRDMKPGHVITGSGGEIHLIDFGIARRYAKGKLSDTETLGTPGFAAPEQYGKGQTDCRTDIYSLGMTLRRMLEACPEMGKRKKKALCRILHRCTEQDPGRRFGSCAELENELQRLSSVRGSYSVIPAITGHITHLTFHKKQRQYILAGVLFILLMCSGGHIMIQGTSLFADEREYHQLIHYSGSQSPEYKIENCRSAIRLKPEDPAAYRELLRLYEENDCFGSEESAEISAYIESSRKNLKTQEGYEDLILYLGKMYIYMYKGSEDFQTRLLMAEPWLEEVKDSGKEAEDFVLLASFYRNYVLPGVKMDQPGAKDYRELLLSIENCLDDRENDISSDHPYSRLSFLDELGKILYSQSAGMLLAGIRAEEITDVMRKISQKADRVDVTRKDCLEMKKEITETTAARIEKLEMEESS